MVSQPGVAPGVGMSGSFEVSATHGHTTCPIAKGLSNPGVMEFARAAADTTANATRLIARCLLAPSSTSLSGGGGEPDSSPTTQ
jgi:hypothetical protein